MLHALAAYAERHLPDSEPGFTTRAVRWCVELAGDGRFLNVQPLGDKKRGEDQPGCPDMHGMNAGGRAHFLVESAQNAVLLLNEDVQDAARKAAERRHHAFSELLGEAAVAVDLLAPVAKAVRDPATCERIRGVLSDQGAKPSDWVGWRVGGVDPREADAVQDWWRHWRSRDLAAAGDGAGTSPATKKSERRGGMVCLLTGEVEAPLPTHPKIKGLAGVGGLPMGDVVVGFDKGAFASYGLTKSENAAMGAAAAQRYVDALNLLIRERSRRLGGAVVAHWFKDRVSDDDDPIAFLHAFEAPGQVEANAIAAARRLLDAIRSGERPDLGANRYYALAVSGAAGRVMVRDWMEGAFEDLVRNVAAWFEDFTIVARHGSGRAPDPKLLGICGALVRDLGDLAPPTAAILMRAALRGSQIPRSLFAQALGRFRADLLGGEPFNHARMGLLKAYFVRRQPGGDPAMSTHLNPDHPDPAYHCGRLLAVLANLQHAALGDVGAGVVQRYYPAASQSPGLVIGRLVSNARNHLGKLEGGLSFWYENRIAEVMSRLGDRPPRMLDLEGQGLFALGYYQQLAALRAPSPSSEAERGETK